VELVPFPVVFVVRVSFWEMAMKRLMVTVAVVALLLGAVRVWQSWKSRQEMLRQLDLVSREAKCGEGQARLRAAEMSCASDLTTKGPTFPQAARYCHYRQAAEWQSWAKACPEQYKQMVENHAIVEATQ
jgi:hypothetical protein